MKRKFLLPILSVCMVAALVSVGFAAWLITGNDTEGTSGQFVTYGVDNDYFSVTAAEVNTTKITFGKDGNPTDPWLTVDDVADQVLSKTFTITIKPDVAFSEETGRDVAKILGGNSVQVTLNGLAASQTAATEDTTAKKYAAAVNNGVIDWPTLSGGSENEHKATDMTAGAVIKLAANDFTVATDKTNATAEVTVTFAWGANGNPYTHYNGLTNTQDNRRAATTALGLVNALNNQSYYLHLAVVPAVAQP